MSIITDNYIWFIISGLVILLITIGYYAEKTNFGKNKLKNVENGEDTGSEEKQTIDITDQVPEVGIQQLSAMHPVEEPLIIDDKPNITTSLPNSVSIMNSSSQVPISDATNNEGPSINVNPNTTTVGVTSSVPDPVVDSQDVDIWKF